MARARRNLCAILLCLALPGLSATAQEAGTPGAPPRWSDLHEAVFRLPPPAGAEGRVLRASDAAGLAAALEKATGGETIRLAPGEYGRLALDGHDGRAFQFSRPVTVTSDDPAAPAVFTSAEVAGVTGMVFDGLVFDYRYAAGDKTIRRAFRFTGSRDLTIRNALFDGDLAQGLSEVDDGYGAGFALTVQNNTDVTLAGNEIRGFKKGLATGGNTNIAILGNEIHALRMDGLTVTGTKGIRIEGNYFHGFLRAPEAKDHSDMIQFWTQGSTRPSTDIVIRGNLLQAGDGGHTQSIFMRNELVDTGRAGREMFYRNVTIEDNVILNGHLHGISIGEAEGVTIRRNTVLRDPRLLARTAKAEAKAIPRIRVNPASLDVDIEDNIAFMLPQVRPGWKIAGNLKAQDMAPTQPGFYDALFLPRPPGSAGGLAALTWLMVRPGSPADKPGLGADLMR